MLKLAEARDEIGATIYTTVCHTERNTRILLHKPFNVYLTYTAYCLAPPGVYWLIGCGASSICFHPPTSSVYPTLYAGEILRVSESSAALRLCTPPWGTKIKGGERGVAGCESGMSR